MGGAVRVDVLVEVRLATIRDLPELDTLIERGYGEIRAKFGQCQTDAAGKYAAEHGILNDQGVVVATAGAKLVGFSLWVWWDLGQPEGEVASLGVWVDPAYRRRGLSLLMDEVAATKCRERGMKYVMMEAAVENEAGVAVIRKRGGRHVGCTFRMDL